MEARRRNFVAHQCCWLSLLARLLVAAVLFPGAASASSFALPSIDEAVVDAKFVVYVRVESATDLTVHGTECGTRTKARILESFKAPLEFTNETKLVFGRDSGLIPGHTYILFLNFASNADALYERVPQKYLTDMARKELFEVLYCDGLVPGYEHLSYLTWEVLNDKVHILGLLPKPWPKSVAIYRESSVVGDYKISREDLFDYLRRIPKY